MITLIFADTETTGLGDEDRLLQLATLYEDIEGKEFYRTNELFNPPMPIGLMAMAVHHITEAMVIDAPAFKGSATARVLQEDLLKPDSFFVAHNAPFDMGMLEKEDVAVPQFICTQKVAKHMDPEGTLESYSMQYLRHYYNIEVEASAHDAMGDVIVLEKVFNCQVVELGKRFPDYSAEEIIGWMCKMSTTPVLLAKMPFGKYKGLRFTEIPKDYLNWMLRSMKDLDQDLAYSVSSSIGQKRA